MFGLTTCMEIADIIQAAKELTVQKRIENAMSKNLSKTLSKLRRKKK